MKNTGKLIVQPDPTAPATTVRRITRNSNGTSRVSPTTTQNGEGHLTLIKSTSTGKRPRSKKTLETRPTASGETTVSDKTKFDFEVEVPFEYAPRPNGFGTVLEFMRRGNETVKDKILNECNFILECRVCNNLFRSPRDFVTHKDKHCTEKYERLTPAGLTELLRLAQNSFKINESSTAFVSVLPPVVSAAKNAQDDPSVDLSFDVNHLVPMLTTVLHPASTSTDKSVQFEPTEVVEAAHTNVGILRTTTRQLPRRVNGEVVITGKYKSQESDNTAIIGADGKAALVGKPSNIQLIVDRLTSQWEAKLESAKLPLLNCQICQIEFASEKCLRIHVRKEHQTTKVRKSVTAKALNVSRGVSKDVKPKTDKPAKPVMNGIADHTKKPYKSTGADSKSKSTKKKSVIDTKTSPRPRFRRLTNNSFSATLSLNPTEIPTTLEVQVEPLPKKRKLGKPGANLRLPPSPSSTATQRSSEEEPQDYKATKAMVKALFVKEKKRRTKSVTLKSPPKQKRQQSPLSLASSPAALPASPRKLSCLKCSAELETEMEMSVHLGNCPGISNSINKIGIIDRHDYITKANVEDSGVHPNELRPTPANAIAMSFNNNKNEVANQFGSTSSSSPPYNNTPIETDTGAEIKVKVEPGTSLIYQT